MTDPSVTNPNYDQEKRQAINSLNSGPAMLQQQTRAISPGENLVSRSLQASAANCFIPLDASYTAIPRNDDGSFGPIALPFAYHLYGSVYNQVWINTNGNLTFTGPLATFTAQGFPIGTPMVAPFWADVDTRNPESGEIHYKVSGTNLIVTWDNVGYYNSFADKLSSFQVVLTDGLDPILGNGLNTAFFYGDMQWTTGTASGGTSGFGGFPATVGVNEGNTTNYVQIGSFNLDNSNYDGPGGDFDGVNYLDGKCFNFNVSNSGNIPPAASGFPANNTINLLVGESISINPEFVGPEIFQQVATLVNTGGLCGVTYSVTNGDVSGVDMTIEGSVCNVGTHTITFTATDNGSPSAETTISLIVNVTNPITYTLTTQAEGPGTVVKDPDQANYSSGETVNLRATPATGFRFAGWSGDATGMENPLPVVMNGNKDITANFAAIGQQVVSFSLIDARNDQVIQTISPGQVINLATLPSRYLNIKANTDPVIVGSVKFALSGRVTKNQTENEAPYALYSDNGGNYLEWKMPVGSYTLKATAFTAKNGGGTTGTPHTVSFTVIDEVIVPQVLSFSLVDATNEQVIQMISPGQEINLATLPTRYVNIKANTNPAYTGSVKFALSGRVTKNQTENEVPYALYADVKGNYLAWLMPVGNYTLKATAYTASNGGGIAGSPMTISFSVVDEVTPLAASRLAQVQDKGSADLLQSVKVYPNPFQSGRLKVQLPEAMAGKVSYSLVSKEGKKVAEGKITLAQPSGLLELDFGSQLTAPGMYILRLQGDKVQSVLKIMRQ